QRRREAGQIVKGALLRHSLLVEATRASVVTLLMGDAGEAVRRQRLQPQPTAPAAAPERGRLLQATRVLGLGPGPVRLLVGGQTQAVARPPLLDGDQQAARLPLADTERVKAAECVF